MARKYSFLCLFGIFVLASILLPKSVIAQTHISEGDVSGEWTKGNSPYFIDGTISVAAGKKLIIRPGTTVFFSGFYSMVVRGTINALGEKDAPIVFSFADSLNKNAAQGWRGIKIHGKAGQKDTAQFIWCRFSHGNATGDKVEKCRGGAIFADSCHFLKISQCSFFKNAAVAGGAVYARNSTLLVEGCRYEQNRSFTDGGALCLVCCNLKMYNNTLLKNHAYSLGGAIMAQGMKASFANNIVVENTARFGAGIAMLNDTSTLVNNTIAENISTGNGGGIHLEKSATRFINSILWGNQTGKGGKQGYMFTGSQPRFWFCNIQEGARRIGTLSSASSYIDEDYNNIDRDPYFVRTDTAFYSLDEGSPCIDYGIPDTASLYLPKTDVANRQRINGRNIDIGAHEFGAALVDKNDAKKNGNEEDNGKPKLKIIAYPNPSGGSFQALVSNPEHKSLVLHITTSAGNILFESPVLESDEVFILPVNINGKPGMYLMNITDNKHKKLKEEKIVIY